MYPLSGLRDAWGDLYRTAAAAVAVEFPETPTELRWDVDAHQSWLDPDMALSQTCGWPLVTVLSQHVRVLGSFVHVLDGRPAYTYRSVIIAREAQPLCDLARSRAAINSDDSLSGLVSLLDAFGVRQPHWPDEVTWTGSHMASIAAVRDRDADVASIDALTWAYLQRLAPGELAGLVVVGRGPEVPCLPLVVPGHATDRLVTLWRAALTSAVGDPQLAGQLDTLLISGFQPLDLQDYETALAPLM
ncbi:unannotated protein [freshwater metagenome]|uniref:Unannotated protein n=1 Tax=freshwater metagenome TaxID=449393 RepID=A0A6J7EVS4_9ZZZZ|nr:PhnD/SsuA/transferrin family substrate-binding protein [Actinomycetota bacterium]